MPLQPTRTARYDQLEVSVYPDNQTLGQAAAEAASAIIREAVAARGTANVILATGNSQLTFLRSMRLLHGFPWNAVNVFHMDEYLNLPPGHSASFPRFLGKHLLDHVEVAAFFPVPGHANDVEAACQGYDLLLKAYPADVCCLGIGENGHLAFNDPPNVDFEDVRWVRVVELAQASRRQQVNEGHFASLDETPTHAITLTVPALLAARNVLAIVPEARKAEAVRRSLREPISEDCPASILRRTAHARLFLDQDSAAQL
jgi:glucosamine-6-phosphate deaminase